MTLSIQIGDITKLRVDAIVNAANSSLLGGGGVDGAIHRGAGKELAFECLMLGGCKTGEAKLTKGYNLPAGHIIHTVGPVWNNGLGTPDIQLENCYKNSMRIAENEGFESLAFPCISTGIYKFPKHRAASIAVRTVEDSAKKNPKLKEIIFCCFLHEDADIYANEFQSLGIPS